ncbi:MAG: type IV pilus secretin PilQ [Desulfosarcina sp.]|nr:type IV pilus secretin PilQ [Desulfosarcina sp.]MBC2743706.1 type IV pilus secretin PilQ [Desulfosarcina sp.]MBC2766615.1 type IV pilus secretin PilQ [Desulfosarcina sp.]
MRNTRIKFSERLTLVFCLGLVVVFFLAACATQNSGSKTGVTDVDPSQSMRITAIGISEESDSINVVINGTEPLTYTSVKQPLPLGVVLYFPNTRLDVANTSVQSTGNPVTSIHAGQIEAKNNTARIEILLASDVPYNVVQDGTSLRIQFEKPTSGSNGGSKDSNTQSDATPQLTAAEETQPVQPAPVQSVKPSGTFQGTGIKIEKDNQIWVNRIDFLGETDGRSTLSIETTATVDFNIQKVSDKLLELRLMNANIAEFRQRPMVTTRFESAVNRIMPIQLPSMKDFSLFSIELREPVPYYTEQTGGLLLVHFEASSVPPAPADETNLPAWKKALEETIGPADIVSAYPKVKQPSGESQATVAKPSEMTVDADQAMVVRKNVKRYTGEKIALDFFQTDIKNVFRILREVSGKNFAIDQDVTGKVTLTLDKPVPWDQVMDLVLRMNQLGMIVEGDIVRIATLTTLKKENDLRKAQSAALHKEKEQIKALEPLETRYLPISYSDANKEILPHIQNIITKERGSVSVDSKNNQIIITDTADKIARAQEITKQIDKVTSQVIIEARVVEVSESFSKELGFSWSGSVGPIGMNDGKVNALGAVAMNYPTASSNGIGFNLTRLLNTPFSLDAQLTALETNGNGKILSSPKIVTLNNQKAKIKQGQEIGYLERDSAGGSSVKFKDVDLLLEVTPHVTPDNRISLDILIEKNDVTGFVDGVPIISTNEAQTQLLVNDGDTIVIGGIIKATATKGKTAFPGLHKIPVLGWMFQSNKEEVDNNELLIFMNPKIVQLEQRTTAF